MPDCSIKIYSPFWSFSFFLYGTRYKGPTRKGEDYFLAGVGDFSLLPPTLDYAWKKTPPDVLLFEDLSPPSNGSLFLHWDGLQSSRYVEKLEQLRNNPCSCQKQKGESSALTAKQAKCPLPLPLMVS